MSNFSFRWNSTVYASFHIHFLFGLFAKVFSYAHISNAHVSASSVVAKFIEVVINCCQVCNLKSSLVFVVGKISAYNERLSCKWYYLSFLEILSWRIPSNDERLPLTRENTLFCKMCHSFLFGCVDLKRRVPSDAWIALQSCLPYETNGTDQIPIFSFQRVVLWLKKFKPWNENWQPWYLRQKIASLFAFTLNQFQGLPVEISFSC